MKLFFKFILALLILAVIAPFFIEGRDGRPLLSFDFFRAPKIGTPEVPDLGGLIDKAGEMLPRREKASKSGPSKVYRWKDAKGTINFSDRPNLEGPSESILVDPNVDVMSFPGPVTSEKEDDAGPSGDGGAPLSIPFPTSIPTDQIPKLIEDARLLKDLSEGRNRELEQLLGR